MGAPQIARKRHKCVVEPEHPLAQAEADRDGSGVVPPEVAGAQREEPAVLGFRAEMEIDDGLAQLATWMAGQEADDRVDAAMDELRRRGLER